jgi:hypothetical protein
MPKAKNTNTPKRRTARGFSAAEIAAGLATPAIASTRPADTDLIRLCVEIATNKARIEAVHPELDALYQRQGELVELLGDAVPTTPAGAPALARASLALAMLDDKGAPYSEGGDSERFGLRVVRFLAGGAT